MYGFIKNKFKIFTVLICIPLFLMSLGWKDSKSSNAANNLVDGYLEDISLDEDYDVNDRYNILSGTYVAKHNIEISPLPGVVTLFDDDTYSFRRPFVASYIPKGWYKIEKDKLYLFMTEYDYYFFTIEDDCLIYEGRKNKDTSIIENTKTEGLVYKSNPDYKDENYYPWN